MTEMSAVFEQVMAQCARGCFTGLLKVRTRDGSGEVRFLSGIQDGVRFASMEGDAALERLLAAREHEYEAVSSLPPIEPGSTEPVPPEGGLDRFHAAQLMRYCESNSLTCALELEVNGKVLTARYRLGELLSVEPDSEHTAELAEAKRGIYRFRLPKFELPASIPQARSAANGSADSAARAAAKPAPSVREPAASAREPAPAPASRSAARPAAPAPAPQPTPAAPASAAMKPAASSNKIAPVAPIPIAAPREAPAPAASRSAARPALDSAALTPTSAQSPLAAPSVRLERTAEPAHREQPAAQTPRAAASPQQRSPEPPAASAPKAAAAQQRPAEPAAAAAPKPAPAASAAKERGAAAHASDARKASAANAGGKAAARQREQVHESEPPATSRHWLILAVIIVAAVVAGWVALGRPLP